MKSILSIVFVLSFSMLVQGQTYIRTSGESIDSLVGRTLDKNSFTDGVYEYFIDNSSIIIYFQVRISKELDKENLYFGETSTMFNVMYSSDNIHYSKYLIDTVGVSNSCWAPVRVDSILFLNIDSDISNEMCLILYHSPYCDAFVSYEEILFFDNYETFPDLKRIMKLTSFNTEYFDLPISDKSQIKASIISTLKERGVLKE